jgi:hypothetical protein
MIEYPTYIENLIAQRYIEAGNTADFVGKENICNLSKIIQTNWESKRCLLNLYYKTHLFFLSENKALPIANYSYFARGVSGIELGLLKFSFGQIKLIRYKERILKYG